MTEQQRREQIMKERQQLQARQTHTALSDADAEKMAAHGGMLTQEQLIAAAMLGKFIQNDITGIKKAAVGEGLKVTNVDMAKVAPSAIIKAAGGSQSAVSVVPTPQSGPVVIPPVLEGIPVPDRPDQFIVPAPVITHHPSPAVPVIQAPAPKEDNGQLELEFDRKARYEDIMKALDILTDKVIILTHTVQELKALVDKKKPKITPQVNGTQTG